MQPDQGRPHGAASDPAADGAAAEPPPRQPPDIEPPISDAGPAVWRYEQPGSSRRDTPRRYRGHVYPITGDEGQRLRDELATVIADLLAWASGPTSQPRGERDDSDDN